MKRYILRLMLLALLALPVVMQGQNKWDEQASRIFKPHFTLQLNAGITQYFGDLNKDDLFNQSNKAAYGGCLGYQITRIVGLRGQFVMGELYSIHAKQQLKLNTDFWDAGLHLTLNINEIFGHYNERRFINFYLFGGAGYTSFESKLSDFNTNVEVLRSKQRANELFVPVGGGASLRLAKHVSLNVEYGNRITFNDNTLDLVESGKSRDQYSYASAGLGFTFGGPRDKDRDGIINKKDKCPDKPGAIELQGCPDKDDDGIADVSDDCPDVKGIAAFNGCPDTDNDGLPDKDDLCPEAAGKKELMGCPDKDNDGIADKDDLCPDAAGKKDFKGCPDKDGDGIPDKDDECPDIAGLAQFGGCMDTDNDSVPDKFDQCPEVKGTIANHGCPEESNILVNEMVHFNTDEWIVIAKYNQLLNKIAETMRDNPGIRISVDGHTDSRESQGYNMRLSENRADYVMKFFLERGIDPSRLEKHFYGETRPAASNMTWEGMAINRRVEIRSIK